jgi:hypothetical protein
MTMQKNRETLLARLPAHSKTAAIRTAADAAFSIVDKFAARRTEMSKSGQYTEAGVSAAMREALPATLRALNTARAPIAKLARDAKAKRASLRPADPDRGDVAGAIERQEIRAYWRTLPPGDRAQLAMTTTDLRLLEALVTAAPELSGFTRNQRDVVDKVEQRYIALKHPAELAEVEALDALVAEAEAITAVTRNDIRNSAALEPQPFEALARKVEAAVWLVGDASAPQVCEVAADGTAEYRLATAEEAVTGVYYKNEAEYQAVRDAQVAA